MFLFHQLNYYIIISFIPPLLRFEVIYFFFSVPRDHNPIFLVPLKKSISVLLWWPAFVHFRYSIWSFHVNLHKNFFAFHFVRCILLDPLHERNFKKKWFHSTPVYYILSFFRLMIFIEVCFFIIIISFSLYPSLSFYDDLRLFIRST